MMEKPACWNIEISMTRSPMVLCHSTNNRRQAHDLAIAALRPLHGSTTLVMINDIRGHSAVLALLDEVLAQSRI
jgi:hypothetical protein